MPSPIAEQGVAILSGEVWAQARHRTEIIGPLAALEAVGLSRRQVYVLIRRARQGAGLVTDLAPVDPAAAKARGVCRNRSSASSVSCCKSAS